MSEKPENTTEKEIKKPKTETSKKTETIDTSIRKNWLTDFFSNKLVIIIHLFVYISVNGLLAALNFMFFQGRLWFWHPIFGWGAGIAIHLGLYYSFTGGVDTIEKTTLLLHFLVFGILGSYLVLVNFVHLPSFGGFIWVILALPIWGFGLGMHAILTKMISDKTWTHKDFRALISKFLLLIHAGYFGIVNVLLLALGAFANVYRLAVGTIFGWGLALVGHTLIVLVDVYLEGPSDAIKGVIIHAIIYGLVQLGQLIQMTFWPAEGLGALAISDRMAWFIMSAGVWAIAIVIHLILAIQWDRTGGDTEVLMKSLLILHICAYAAGVALMFFLNFSIWQGRLWVPTAAIGWAIGLACHTMLYIFIKDKEKDGLKISLYLDIIAYVCTMVLLLWLNFTIWEGRLWVPTIALGWGVGLGEHLLLYWLKENDMFTTENGLKASVYMHLVAYAIINGLLIWLNLSNWEGRLWFPIPMVGWGIGLGVHILLGYFLANK